MTKALVVIDVQKWGFTGDWKLPNSDEFLQRIAQRVAEERAKPQHFILHIQNDGPEGELDGPGGEFWPVMIEPIGDEWLVRKTTQDVFESNPDLAQRLREAGVTELELIGAQSEMCVRSSALGAKAAGFKVHVPEGMHTTYDESFTTGKPGLSAAEISAKVQQELESFL